MAFDDNFFSIVFQNCNPNYRTNKLLNIDNTNASTTHACTKMSPLITLWLPPTIMMTIKPNQEHNQQQPKTSLQLEAFISILQFHFTTSPQTTCNNSITP